jgi:hypothetical protein
MSDYLAHLAARALNVPPPVRPRHASLFEPVPAAGSWDAPAEGSHESEARRPVSATSASLTIAAEAGTGVLQATTVPQPAVPELPPPKRPVAAEARLVPSPPPRPEPAAGERAPAMRMSPVVPASPTARERIEDRRGDDEREALVQGDRDPAPRTRRDDPPVSARHELRAWSRRTDERLSKLEESRPHPHVAVLDQTKRIPDPGTRVLHPVVTAASRPRTGPDPVVGPSPPPPVIQVTIGRVEVRAVAPAPPPPRRKPAAPRPGVTLEEYLVQRRGGRT